ncbi:MAG: DUF624 domain-containing protein [Chloroflexi bacterium]|nr:DUF624 domain-containing protein [Chloroflexota bacterium]
MGQLSASVYVIRRALADWWYDWVSLALINVVWALAVLTLVLAPPATLAAFYATNQLAQGRSVSVSDFVSGFRQYFLLSYAWAAVNVMAAVLVWSGIRFYGQFGADWSLLLLLLVVAIGLGWLVVQFYALPYLMEQEQRNVLVALRNGLFTGLASPLYTLVLAIFSGAIIALSLALVALIFLGGPCLIALLANHAVRERLVTFGIRPQPNSSGDQKST